MTGACLSENPSLPATVVQHSSQARPALARPSDACISLSCAWRFCRFRVLFFFGKGLWGEPARSPAAASLALPAPPAARGQRYSPRPRRSEEGAGEGAPRRLPPALPAAPGAPPRLWPGREPQPGGGREARPGPGLRGLGLPAGGRRPPSQGGR